MNQDVVILTLPEITPEMQWEVLKKEIIQKIEALDNATPWSEQEPAWWHNMMDVRALVDTF